MVEWVKRELVATTCFAITSVEGASDRGKKGEFSLKIHLLFWFLPLPKVTPFAGLKSFATMAPFVLFSYKKEDPTQGIWLWCTIVLCLKASIFFFFHGLICVHLVHRTIHLSRSHCLPWEFFYALSCTPLHTHACNDEYVYLDNMILYTRSSSIVNI